jgi:hypothetical protein
MRLCRLSLALCLVTVAACSKSDTPPASTGSVIGSGTGSVIGSGSGSATGSDAGSATGSGSGSGSATVADLDAGAAAGSGSGSSTTAAVTFADLSKKEQAEYMRTKVVPAMKKAFQAFDAKDFAKLNCKTCHGKGAITKEYDMPNPDLPKLDFAELRAGKHAEIATFMKDEVVPQMAELLGEQPRSASNPDGFGCLECHEEKK